MSTNWELCLFSQEKKRSEKNCGKILPHFKIYTKLKTFIEIDPTYIELGRLDDGASSAKTLETQNAVYYKKCYDKIGRKEYNRLWRDSELNHAVRLIQQLSHTREQKLSLEQSYAFFVER